MDCRGPVLQLQGQANAEERQPYPYFKRGSEPGVRCPQADGRATSNKRQDVVAEPYSHDSTVMIRALALIAERVGVGPLRQKKKVAKETEETRRRLFRVLNSSERACYSGGV